MFSGKYSLPGIFMIFIPVILAGFGSGLFIGAKVIADMNSPPADALNRIVQQNPNMVMEHEEHYGLMLSNGDLVEFSKDTSLSDADIVMLINVAGLNEGVVDLKNVQPCPPPGQKIESGKFCYIPSEVLAMAEPHLAEVYPEGILLRPYDL